MSPRAARIAVALLVVWGFALRAWLSWPEPNAHRFWDERFALENVVHVLRSGRLEPANGFHPMLSWLPTTAFLAAAREVHSWVEPEAGDPFLRPRRGHTAELYRVGRLFHVGLGALSIWLSARIGRRLGGRTTGVLAAAFTAFLPRHVLFSCLINEDMPLVVGCQVALLASMAAVRSGRWPAFARAGAAIGVALASKFVAAPVSLPLVAAAARLPISVGARVGRVALAGLVAAATLVAVSPHLVLETELYRRDFFGETARLYEVKEVEARAEGRNVILSALSTLAGDRYFGPTGAALAVGGAGVAVAWRRRRPGGWRRAALVLGLFPLVFVALYAARTGHARPHAWLPLAPVVAAFAGLGGRELARRARRAWRKPGLALASAVLLASTAAIAVHAHAMAHEQTTSTCAEHLLRVRRGAVRGAAPRVVAVDERLIGELGGEGPLRGDRTAYVALPAEAARRRAASFDAVLLAGAGPAGETPTAVCRPRPLRTRGTPARLLVGDNRRLRPTPVPARAGAAGTIEFELPAAARAGEFARLEIRLPRRFDRERVRGRLRYRLELAGAPIEVHAGRDTKGGPMLISERIERGVAPVAGRLVLETRPLWTPGRFSLRLWSGVRHEPPGEGGAAPQSPASSSSASSPSSSVAAAKSPGIRSPGRGR